MEIPVPVQPSWLRRASAPLPGLSAPGRLFDQRFGEGLLEAELAALCPTTRATRSARMSTDSSRASSTVATACRLAWIRLP
uniref:cDNA FLJ51314, weakly similar to Heat-shock protein beta-6 n=1 Tax=Homo sapiens TaxID=9606 RepID=B4DUL6_HUMAN|nr:unnamed protein product [Homo sapiens]